MILVSKHYEQHYEFQNITGHIKLPVKRETSHNVYSLRFSPLDDNYLNFIISARIENWSPEPNSRNVRTKNCGKIHALLELDVVSKISSIKRNKVTRKGLNAARVSPSILDNARSSRDLYIRTRAGSSFRIVWCFQRIAFCDLQWLSHSAHPLSS